VEIKSLQEEEEEEEEGEEEEARRGGGLGGRRRRRRMAGKFRVLKWKILMNSSVTFMFVPCISDD